MHTMLIKLPSFRDTQRVSFVGGEGIVRSYKFEFGGWTYLVEMALEEEPDFGRIGSETMLLLNEADLCAV
jgi:hypothetical protein